jgi:hypothetical protein
MIIHLLHSIRFKLSSIFDCKLDCSDELFRYDDFQIACMIYLSYVRKPFNMLEE